MESAYEWKRYYRTERDRMGAKRLLELVDAAQPLALAAGGAIVIPHTRMEATGDQIARAVATVLAARADRVLALGVLHGARRVDRSEVALARSGDADAIKDLRGVHEEAGLASEEFSLDGFVEMLTLAADRAGRRVDIIRRYPFLVGDDPATLPGMDQLERLVGGGALIVATTDPIHHGHAYGTAPHDCLDPVDPDTVASARSAIDDQLAALSDHRFADFGRLMARDRSDFRDTGPTLAHLVGAGFSSTMHDLALVDYSEPFAAPPPSWVAGALVTV
jgi:hypothetical protein